MDTTLIVTSAQLPSIMEGLRDRARDYARRARSNSTQHAYKTDWRHFEEWCTAHDRVPFPADLIETVIPYLTAFAEVLKVSTLLRRLSTIRVYHRSRGVRLDTSDERFRIFWQGLRNDRGVRLNKKAPFMSAALRRALQILPGNLQGHRDRALLLIGFAAGLRRAELAGLTVKPDQQGSGWIELAADGLVVQLNRSKTNQAGDEEPIGIPFGSDPKICPVRAYQAWLKLANIEAGPVFRSISRHGHMSAQALTGAAVALIVKRIVFNSAIADGFTMAEASVRAETFAGHSLRAGLATSAAENDAPGHAIQRQLRHKSFQTTIGYIRNGSLFKGNAASFALK
jgi:site-specific recombinase XerD